MTGWDGQGLHDDTVSTNAIDEDEDEEDDDEEEEEEEESTAGGVDDDDVDNDPPPRPTAMSFSDLAAVTGWEESEQQVKDKGQDKDQEEEDDEEAYEFESSYEDRAGGLASSTEEGERVGE